MKILKSLRRLFRLLILKLTSSGRKELMYEKALSNMKEAHTLSTLEKRILKSEVNFFVNKILKRKRVTSHHLDQLVNAKYGAQLSEGKMKWNGFKVVDA